MARPEDRLSLVLRWAIPLLFLWMIRDQIVPLALAALFALLLTPVRRWLSRRLGRFGKASPVLVTTGAVVGVVIPFAFVAARLAISINTFVSGDLPDVLGTVQVFVTKHLAGVSNLVPLENLRDAAISVGQKIGGSVAAFAAGVATALPGQIVDLFLFTLALFYFLQDGGRLVDWLARLSPFEESDTKALFASVRETVYGVIVGQLATSAVQGSLTTLALWIFGIPGALLFGVIATLLSVVPMVGTTPVTVGAAIYLLAVGRPGAAAGMAVAAVVIGGSDNIVRPWVQSAQAKMHPLVTLLAIFGGISLFGAAGVFLGPVVAAMAVWAIGLRARNQPPPSARAGERSDEAEVTGQAPRDAS